MKDYFCKGELINKDKIYLYNESLAKKYNAIVNFFKNKEKLLEMGCYNTTFRIFYVVEDETYINKILIYDECEKHTYEITDPKRLYIDRKFKMLNLNTNFFI